jgi:hypothetical protein
LITTFVNALKSELGAITLVTRDDVGARVVNREAESNDGEVAPIEVRHGEPVRVWWDQDPSHTAGEENVAQTFVGEFGADDIFVEAVTEFLRRFTGTRPV